MDRATILMGARAFLDELSRQDNFGTYMPIYAVMENQTTDCGECGSQVLYSAPIRWFFLNETAEEYIRCERRNLRNASIYVFSASGNVEYDLIVNTIKLCVEQAAEVERLKKEIEVLTAGAG